MKTSLSRATLGIVWCACLWMGTASAAAAPAALHVYTSGSMAGALAEIAARYTQETGQAVEITSGAAGLLRQRIEKGAGADVYVSANLANAQHLAQDHLGSPAVIIARNSLCIIARSQLHLTADNLLETLSKPSVKIGTSTPGADPGGDYAWAWFASLDAAHPGTGKVLRDKAQQLVGGAVAPKVPAHISAVTWFLQQGRVDAFVSYCSSKQPNASPAPGLVKIAIPPQQSVPVNYAMSVLLRPGEPTRQIEAYRFANFLLTPDAQARLPRYGFIPVTGIDAGNASATSDGAAGPDR
ncbi:MAG TPA: extracellular solute-binding protein [Rhodanobacter sp.]|nr:extracellular solute-binding protein [Rhodanobacter sp.]